MRCLFVVALTLFILSGCNNCDHCDDQPINYNYTFFNDSAYQLDVVPYENGSLNYSGKVTVLANAKIQKEYKDGAPYDGYNMGKLLFERNVYQVDIVFNNQKKIHYKSCSDTYDCNVDSGNIFNNLNNSKQTEIYTIKSVDYQNATDCGGNCY